MLLRRGVLGKRRWEGVFTQSSPQDLGLFVGKVSDYFLSFFKF